MKIDDTKTILEMYAKQKLTDLKSWVEEDAPHLYESWSPDAEKEEVEYSRYYFEQIEKSEWFGRKGK